MSIPNWPPPSVAITYRVVCRGNDVYRVEGARVVESVRDHGESVPELMGATEHLLIALEVLGLEPGPTWAGYLVTDDEMSSHVVAWMA